MFPISLLERSLAGRAAQTAVTAGMVFRRRRDNRLSPAALSPSASAGGPEDSTSHPHEARPESTETETNSTAAGAGRPIKHAVARAVVEMRLDAGSEVTRSDLSGDDLAGASDEDDGGSGSAVS